MFEAAIYIIRGFAILFFIGLIVDFPEQRRKKRKENCKNGKHRFGKWIDQYEIHNGNDVWHKQCKHCKTIRETVSKLTPATNVEGWIYKR